MRLPQVSFSMAMVEAGHVCRRRGELGAAGLDALVVALDVVGEEVGRRLPLLTYSLLIRFGRGIVVQRQLQLSAIGSSGETTVSQR